MTFAGFTCWDTQDIADVLVIDAVTPYDSVFLATHHPMHMTRREIEAVEGDDVDEHRLLEDLLTSQADPLLIPVVGQAGSGKSHVVRWLKAALSGADDDATASLHVVYVPKLNTGLRRVIELIIDGFEGPEFASLREELQSAADYVDDTEAPVELLNRLAAAFETWEPAGRDPDIDRKRFLAGPTGIAALLYSNAFREPLLAEGGVIRGYVEQARHGKERSDKGEPFEFTVDDLPTSPERVSEAAKEVREFYRHFSGDDRLQGLAAEQMTEFLHRAIRDLVGVKGDELQRIFARVRQILHAQNKELVLLIEDFAVLQAVRHELLDALLVPTVQEGEERLCRLRTVMAVTTGYLERFEDTVRTRIRHVYSLDIDLEDLRSEVLAFVGRYLNAVRLGVDRLNQARRVSDIDDQTWVPNACDECPMTDDCHPAFGRSERGHGLYPFNPPALLRAIEAKLRRFDGRFDPREILRAVLDYTLRTHHSTISQGTFPNASFARQFDDPRAEQLPSMVERRIAELDPVDADRREVLLAFWGGCPDRVANLEEGIHEAFQLPQLEDVGSGATTKTHPPKPVRPETTPTAPSDSSYQTRLDAIQDWRRGEDMRRAVRQHLRERIQQLIAGTLDWEGLTLRAEEWLRRGKEFSVERIHFDEEDAQDGSNVSLVITRENLDDVQAVEAIVHLDEHDHWDFTNGAMYARVLRLALLRWAATVEPQLRASIDQADLRHAVEGLILGSAVLGHLDRAIDDPALIAEAIMRPAPDIEIGTSAVDPWHEARRAAAEPGSGRTLGRDELIDLVKRVLGTSKGGSGPQALDARRLSETIHAAIRNPTPIDDLGRDPVDAHLSRLLRAVPDAIHHRTKELLEWKDLVTTHLGEESGDLEELQDEVLGAISSASQTIGVSRKTAFEDLKSHGRSLQDLDLASLRGSVDEALAALKDADVREGAAILAGLPKEAIEGVRAFLEYSHEVFGDIERRVEQHRATSDIDDRAIDEELAHAVDELDGLVAMAATATDEREKDAP